MKHRLFSFGISLVMVAMAFASTYNHIEQEKPATSAPAIHKPKATETPESGSRPSYRIDATYHPERDEVTAKMEVTVPNRQSETWREIYFHLYPNVFRKWKYGEESKPSKPGHIQVHQVKVNGQPVKEKLVRDEIMKVPLREPLTQSRTARITMDFTLRLPHGGTRLNTFKQTAFLAQWYPMMAVKDQGGWQVEPYTTVGDPFYTEISDFTVTFRMPKGYRLISTGRNADTTSSVVTVKQDRVRDFVAVLTKDYRKRSAKSGRIDVNLWYLPDMERSVKPLLEAAVQSMDFFGEIYGAYPYDEVDVVLGETGFGIAGMEYPGLITSIPTMATEKGIQPAVSVVAHELAHQWWYGVVGNNQAKEPWLDEGLTTFSEFLFMKEKMKSDEQEFLRRATQKTNEIHQAAGITCVDTLYSYPDMVYGLMVYIRPAAMMFELMDEIGRENVLKIMRAYYEQYQFKTATTQDFIRVANRTAGKELTPFFHKWLYFGK
ncbi:Peptidase family M1 [Laceyella tengchongensis]|uniref:Peptidase family M1 n=1 Tax=Laceyella tengchongensis TaxID=574699 RepID=A0AA45WLV7_9BACL|nr:M1 family metallopeptidase [Laceyella tengchongensis]SMP12239.1 Peptidase family M1 [Laceyella tengchongensis]